MTENDLFLPEHFDGNTVAQITSELLARRGSPVELKGGRVKSVGVLGLQVLMAARKQWCDDDAQFRVIEPSDAMVSAGQVLGLDPVDMGFATGTAAT